MTSLSQYRNVDLSKMKTKAFNIGLSKADRLIILKEAKETTWYDNWKPYCLVCDCYDRMEQHEYGFECLSCRNMIGWDLTRLVESPLNL